MIWKFRGPLFHLIAQFTYIYISFSMFALKREGMWLAATLLLSVSLYALTRALNRVQTSYKIEWVLSALLMGNSVFLNLEGHGILPYLLAVSVGILAMSIFRGKHTHIFNPSAVGVLAVAILWSDKASFADWAHAEWFTLLILCFGTITVYLADRWRVSYGYILGYISVSFLVLFLHKLFGTPSYNVITPFFWPLTLLAPASLIFIFHVISDPKTIPITRGGQWVFGLAIGALDISLRGVSFLPAPFVSYLLMQALYGLMPHVFDTAGDSLNLRLLGMGSVSEAIVVWRQKVKQFISSTIISRSAVSAVIFCIGVAVGVLFLPSYLRGQYDKRITIRITPYEMDLLLRGMNNHLFEFNLLLDAAAKNDIDEVSRLATHAASNYMLTGLPWIAEYMPKGFRELSSDSHGAFSLLDQNIRDGRLTAAQIPQALGNIQKKCLACHEKYRFEYAWSLRRP